MTINHIGFIMDGNRRYSKKNNISIENAYKKGMLQFIDFVKFQVKYDVFETSFFALSNDNYEKRPDAEKKVIASLIKFFSDDESIWNYFLENNIHVELKGNIKEMEKKSKTLSKEKSFFISKLKKKAQENNSKIKEIKFRTNIALNYGGQEEILFAFKNILEKIDSKKINVDDITIQTIKENIYFSSSKPVQVIVRPGDAPRLSGFMLWDSAYSELYLTKKLWPELDEGDFKEIILWYNNLKRNFGK